MKRFLPICMFAVCMFAACKQEERLIEKVFVVNIKPGEDTLRQYLQYHAAVWPEVEQGFRKAGYRSIRMFRSNHTLVMTVTVPEGADLDAMGKTAESYNPRCAEWNRLMAGYQEGVAGTAAGQTWTEAKPFYTFSDR
ncbi:L-rhamnose mutarotase [Chitinophaga sp. GCM10012297]|uniref:L-rhamnose mutarotase n=1 Tax=Chitinophaga chungangae TaxID=2821488 RepID=A0ABS3YG16_9BACT|nr:L-rhamnose mutarotase [Chitinophaga chungangae]MBO9153626.1 L-rhamnose mutarotase [Chitinophaga chungangae]